MKLLHERLRDYISPRWVGLESIYKAEDVDIVDSLIKKFADEIERYYIPRPRFEDGEPVPWNGEYESDSGRASKLTQLYLAQNGQAILGRKGKRAVVNKGEFVKRPTPKVCDADGVPCKPDDRVWSISKEGVYEEGDLMIVVGIDAGVKERQVLVRRALGGAGEVWVNASALTHERPVFDANGERIRKDDMVWHVGDASRGTVVGIIMDNTWHGYPVKVAWDKGDEGFYQGNALTHREPDSLEKLLDDISRFYSTDPEAMRVTSTWYQRIEALIERGA